MTAPFQSTVRLMMALSIVAMIVCAGCGNKPADREAAQAGNANADSSGDLAADNDASEVDDEAMSQQSFDQLKELFSGQVEGAAVQAETLRKISDQNPDQELSGMVKQIESKVAGIKTTFASLKSAEKDSKTLKVDLPKQLGEASELAAKAYERVQVVARAAAGLKAP